MTLFHTLQAWLATRAVKDERGATAVEYGMIVALIAAVIVAVVAALGGHINGAFDAVRDEISSYVAD